jgi:preprotein translocase subunit Sec63
MSVILRQSFFKAGLVRAIKSPIFGLRTISDDYRPDYYSALGVSKAADLKNIKLAYFRMAKKYHPVRRYFVALLYSKQSKYF